MPNVHEQRVQNLQQHIEPNTAWLISDPHVVHYLTGFETLVPDEREGFVWLSPQELILLHAAFSPHDVPLACQKLNGVQPHRLKQHLSKLLVDSGITTLLFDPANLFFNEYQMVEAAINGLPKTTTQQPELSSAFDHSLVWQYRMIKDKLEQQALREAGRIAHQAFIEVVGQTSQHLSPSLTERQLAHQLNARMIELGASKPAFPTIVAFGPHGALPHHQPTDLKLKPETPILIDFGANYQGYCSDMTRSFWYGQKPSETFQTVATTVHTAYQKALDLLTDISTQKPLPTAERLDQTARTHITKAGYGPKFIHTLGHGLGLQIHEQPSLNSRNTLTLKPGMAVTIEPGIYLEGEFGYRFENTLLITDSSPIVLTDS